MHLLGERQVAQETGEDVGQRIDSAPPTLVLLEREVFAFRRSRPRQLLERHALLLRKSERGRRRLSVLAKCRRHRRAGNRLVEVFLTLRDVRDANRQPSRRAEAFDRRTWSNTELGESRREAIGELARQLRHPRRRQFFDADLDEEFSIHA